MQAPRRSKHQPDAGPPARGRLGELAARSIDAFADFLGAKPFLFGREPTGIDATAFAFLAAALCPIFTTAARTAGERHDNLRAYVGRMTARYYPERSEMAGCVAVA